MRPIQFVSGPQARRWEPRMTYCVALRVNAGLVMLADTRTNAGLDDISRFRKLFTYDVPGERVLGVMMSGNLSITQGVHSILSRAIRNSADDPGVETLLNCDSMFRAAQIVGEDRKSTRLNSSH